MKFGKTITARSYLIHIIGCVLLPVTSVLFGCVKEFDPFSESESKLVVEGWIESDGFPVVILTTSINPASGNDVNDIVASWGKVTISDGERTVVMTGSIDYRYFPPYVYRTSDMKGEPGKSYTIVAEHNGKKVKAVSKMPQPMEIAEYHVSKIDSNDSLRSIEITALSPGNGYCRVFSRVLGRSHRFYPSMMSSTELPQAGEKVTLPVFNGKSILDTLHFVPQMHIGDTVDIKLATIDYQVYKFWTDYDNAVNFGGTVFITSSNSLRSNIEGGYGVWSAQGVSSIRIVVE